MIEPTNLCNLQCPLCPSGAGLLNRPQGFITFDLFKKIIDEIKFDSFLILLWNQGEPFLHKDIIKMIEYAHLQKMIVILSTNANVFPDPNELIVSGLDLLIISMDGVEQETYNKYRVNGELEKVIENVKKLIKAKDDKSKSNPRTICQFIVMKHNEHEIKEIESLVRKIKIDQIVLKTVQIYTKEDIENFLPKNPKYQRYKIKDNDFNMKYNIKNRCYRMWNRPVVNCDGEMSICCYDKNNVYKIGNLKNKRLIDIWKSKEYHTFRQNILKNRKMYDICRNCGEGISLKI